MIKLLVLLGSSTFAQLHNSSMQVMHTSNRNHNKLQEKMKQVRPQLVVQNNLLPPRVKLNEAQVATLKYKTNDRLKRALNKHRHTNRKKIVRPVVSVPKPVQLQIPEVEIPVELVDVAQKQKEHIEELRQKRIAKRCNPDKIEQAKQNCVDANQELDQINACQDKLDLDVKVCHAGIVCDLNHQIKYTFCNKHIIELRDSRNYTKKKVQEVSKCHYDALLGHDKCFKKALKQFKEAKKQLSVRLNQERMAEKKRQAVIKKQQELARLKQEQILLQKRMAEKRRQAELKKQQEQARLKREQKLRQKKMAEQKRQAAIKQMRMSLKKQFEEAKRVEKMQIEMANKRAIEAQRLATLASQKTAALQAELEKIMREEGNMQKQEFGSVLNTNETTDTISEAEIMGEDEWGEDEDTQWAADSIDGIQEFNEGEMNDFVHDSPMQEQPITVNEFDELPPGED